MKKSEDEDYSVIAVVWLEKRRENDYLGKFRSVAFNGWVWERKV